MGCGKTAKEEDLEGEEQLKELQETQASSRTLILAAEAYTNTLQQEEENERSMHQSFIQKLEVLQEKVDFLSTKKQKRRKHKQASACHSRPVMSPSSPQLFFSSPDLALIESNAHTKLEEIRQELRALRSMALGC